MVSGEQSRAATILNPSFDEPLNGTPIRDWLFLRDGGWGSGREDALVNGLPTDGTYSGRVYSWADRTMLLGDYGSVTQVVNLLGVDSITFDASLDQFSNGSEQDAWSPVLLASFRINGVEYWSSNTAGGYFDQTVDTSSLTGSHTLEFRVEAVTAGLAVGSNWFLFDNMRINVPEPSSLTLATLGCFWMARRTRPHRAGRTRHHRHHH